MRNWLKYKNWTVILWVIVILLIGFNIFVGESVAADSDTRLQVTVLDVGQGDSILIRSPDGKYGLVDGGRGSAVMGQLAENLRGWNQHFDFVIATHPDADHIEGLVSVLESYPVTNVFWEENKKTNSIITKLRQLVSDKHIANYDLNEDNDFKLGCCVNFDVIWPIKGFDTYDADESNDVSLTVVIRYKDFQMMIGGDLPAAEEELAFEKLPVEQRNIDVLKVSHHGSKYSTSAKLLDMIDTKVGLISVGNNNSYGHPTAEVLQNLKNAGVEVFRTDKDGAIHLYTDGELLEIQTANQLEKLGLKD